MKKANDMRLEIFFGFLLNLFLVPVPVICTPVTGTGTGTDLDPGHTGTITADPDSANMSRFRPDADLTTQHRHSRKGKRTTDNSLILSISPGSLS